MNWSMKALASLFALSLLGVASASPTSASLHKRAVAKASSGCNGSWNSTDVSPAGISPLAVPPGGQCQCSSCADDGPVMEIGWYSDANCQNLVGTVTYYAYNDAGSGCATCSYPGNTIIYGSPDTYGKVGQCYGDCNGQVAITRDQQCPPGGASAVVATFSTGSQDCVGLHGITGSEGAATYRVGGAPFARRELDGEDFKGDMLLDKRDDTCTGFNVESQANTYSATVQVSDIVNCRNSAAPCTITSGEQHTTSVTSSYTLTAGGDIFGITASATFGQSFTDSETTSIQQSFSVAPNQEGYLSAYSQATIFRGTFTGCDGGDKPGNALVLKSGTLTYQIVVTNG